MSNTVHLWVDTIADRTSFDNYVEESYSEDDAPINGFAADEGKTFNDHDFVDVVFFDKPESVESAVARVSYGDSFADQSAAAARLRDIGDINCIFADYHNQFGNPQSVDREGILLAYLGNFSYEETPYSIPEPKLGDPIFLKPRNLTDQLPLSIAVSPNRPFILGNGQVSPDEDALDLSTLVPNIAERQAEIRFVAEKERWELRDLASNGLTMYRKELLEGDFACPFNGIRFSIGDIEFDWSVEP